MLHLLSFVCCFVALSPCIYAKKASELTVLGGEDVESNELNFVVSVFIRKINSEVGASCSGSIIAPEWILTAAHCLEGTSPLTHVVEVYAGMKTSFQGTPIQADFWYPHEFYSQTSNPLRVNNDIALIKLSSPATARSNTAVAKLPKANEQPPPEKSSVTIVGFGIEGEGKLSTPRRDVMKKANMKVKGTCANTFPYCIRATNLDGRSCNGDSGGPMIYNDVVVGVSSTGTVCSTKNGDSQYTQVSKYITWIKSKVPSLR